MGRPTTLRVGICYCAPGYRGKLEGREVVLSHLREARLRHAERFVLREVVIPSRSLEEHRGAIREGRCHLFLDVHEVGKGYFETALALVELIPGFYHNKAHERLFIGTVPFKFWQVRNREWMRKRPPSPQEVIRGIERLLGSMNAERFRLWEGRMTPLGWRQPRLEPSYLARH